MRLIFGNKISDKCTLSNVAEAFWWYIRGPMPYNVPQSLRYERF